VLALEPFARGLAGHLKPVEAVAIAPGAALNWVVAQESQSEQLPTLPLATPNA